MVVEAGQRFKRANPCPVCGGHDQSPRGQGTRCYGFLSPDGSRAMCTDVDRAGMLTVNPGSDTYPHKLKGSCNCGSSHFLPNPTAAAKAPKGEIEETYDYKNEDWVLLSQVVRMINPKSFRQRRPDGKGGWIWRLNNVRRVLYKLPDLLAEPDTRPVFVVEGEKDVNRLWMEGAVATTNPQGALKWSEEFSESLAGRHVIILPDNDPRSNRVSEDLKGQKHAMLVARSLSRHAASVRVLELPDVPSHGDVSDYLDDGGTLAQLYELSESVGHLHTLADPYLAGGGSHYPPASVNGTNGAHPEDPSGDLFITSKYREDSKRFMAKGLLQRGSFIWAEGRFYYFEDASKTICELDSFDMEALISEEYSVNSTEQFYKFLLKDMRVECHQRGHRARISALAQYVPAENLLFLDLGKGRMLKLDGETITEVDNGSHGVLFAKTHQMESWTFNPNVTKGLIGNTLIRPLNFVSGDGTPFEAEEQQLLLFIWMLSIAFEAVQPTKPLALAMGPAGSGKSSMFRRIGRMLYGPDFEIDGIRKDGEDDFFVATTNAPFVAFDNVDRYIPWLEDALATSATGMKVTKRVLYETNRAVSYIPRAFIALTARTPHFRREDVAERIIPFRLDKLTEKRAEFELLEEIADQRDDLMSEYAIALNKVVATEAIKGASTGLRLADFANVAIRIGISLEREEQTRLLLNQLQTSQHIFATEENDLYILLDLWIQVESPAGSLGVETPNNGREVGTTELFESLQKLAESHGYKWSIKTPAVLGKELTRLKEALGIHFEIDQGRHNAKNYWTFTLRNNPESQEN